MELEHYLTDSERKICNIMNLSAEEFMEERRNILEKEDASNENKTTMQESR